jgi:hypothetical protein
MRVANPSASETMQAAHASLRHRAEASPAELQIFLSIISEAQEYPRSSFAKLDTSMLRAAPFWVKTSLHPKANREGGERTAMSFWLVAVLSAMVALALVWGLYLMARRWM